MGFLDNLFKPGSQTSKTTTQNKLPDWVNNAAQNNYNTALGLSQRPYTPYPFQRIAGFTGDQNQAMAMLRNYAPTAMKNGANMNVPRLIDEIGKGGTVEAYMNPYIDQVLNRTQKRIREATDFSRQWEGNMAQHQDGAFGDMRHGIADAQIEAKGMQQMGDAAANAYAAAYDNAQQLRQYDINNIFNKDQANLAHQQQFLSYLDALYRSGSNQQSLNQNSMQLAYQDFLNQLQYPLDQYNLLVAGLNQSPYDTTSVSKTKTPTASSAAQILGGLGSIFSLF